MIASASVPHGDTLSASSDEDKLPLIHQLSADQGFDWVGDCVRSIPVLRQDMERGDRLARVCEQIAAFGTLCVLSPFLLMIAFAVRCTSAGPVLYRQTRLGLYGRPFQILKFRSMVVDAEKRTGAVWASKGDPRVTLVGRFLRFSHLDELPQLWNIVKGEMSFVGPRPERPEIIRDIENQIPRYWDRLAVLPGVTGLAQVNLDPDDSIASVKRKFELDLEYIYTTSRGLDLRIGIATILKMCGVPKQIAAHAFALRRIPLLHSCMDAEPQSVQSANIEDWNSWGQDCTTASMFA